MKLPPKYSAKIGTPLALACSSSSRTNTPDGRWGRDVETAPKQSTCSEAANCQDNITSNTTSNTTLTSNMTRGSTNLQCWSQGLERAPPLYVEGISKQVAEAESQVGIPVVRVC